jgi:alpha-tubulin suppressor-like RCC1 family protein
LKFVKVLAGPTHYAALDLFGNLFLWGDCTAGCLGTEYTD